MDQPHVHILPRPGQGGCVPVEEKLRAVEGLPGGGTLRGTFVPGGDLIVPDADCVLFLPQDVYAPREERAVRHAEAEGELPSQAAFGGSFGKSLSGGEAAEPFEPPKEGEAGFFLPPDRPEGGGEGQRTAG